MSALAILAIALVSVWLATLSIVAALLVRQVALLSKRLDPDYAMDGLLLGRRIPDWLSDLLPDESGALLFLGASCNPCRKLAYDLGGLDVDQPVVAVIEGGGETSEKLAHDLPSSFKVLTGEMAELAFSDLGLETTPFLFWVDRRKIVNKAVPRGAPHFLSLLQTPEMAKVSSPQAHLVEVSNVG